MLYREIIAVCSEIHTKDINTLCGQNVELLNVKLAVRTVTSGLWSDKYSNVSLVCHSLTHRYRLCFINVKCLNSGIV